jgi:hypothetical protein
MEVDIRFMSVESVDQQVAKGHEILCWALKYGTALYDLEGVWSSLQTEWENRIPMPSAKEARERAEKTLCRAIEMLESDDESAADDLVLATITQFVREQLINNNIFPASRPELANQLRMLHRDSELAALLEESLYGSSTPGELINWLKRLGL